MARETTVGHEIASQPDVWAATWRRLRESRQALSDILFSGCWDAVYFCGSGSTYYLALAAANLHQQLTGQRTRAVPSSEISLFPRGVYPDILGQQILLIALSRSGETTEVLQAVQRHHARHLPVLAITTRAGSSLARGSDAFFAAQEAQETSVPQTRSFTSMYLATQYIAGLVADNLPFMQALEQLPERGRRLLARADDVGRQVAELDWERALFLGSGPYYGLACEGMLKLKEMALAWSEAYHFQELRHGPISLVDDRTLAVGLLGESAAEAERAVLADVRDLGGQTFVIGEQVRAEVATQAIALDSGLSELARGALYLLPLQLVAYHRARARGLDPDRPRHLRQAVVLAEA